MNSLIIGIDLDNTLVSYDRLFYKLALEQGLIPAHISVNKTEVRDYLRKINQEPAWTSLQGLAYGTRMGEAEPFPGALTFVEKALKITKEVYIVSHKTQYPIVGDKIDLHEAARAWLESQGFHDKVGLPHSHVWFEPTKSSKLQRIARLNCTVFIDDLPELLSDPQFPQTTRSILFTPQGVNPIPSFEVAHHWSDIATMIGV